MEDKSVRPHFGGGAGVSAGWDLRLCRAVQGVGIAGL